MIPKIIHYCWFGGNPLPELAIKCIASWKKYFPDYEIKEWNETNYDVHKIPYISEAYNAKKYAFVSDYARFDILYKYGGIYFDTDVEVIKPFDDILKNGGFMGFEFVRKLYGVGIACNSGLGIGCNSGLEIVYKILEYYSNLRFINIDGSYNLHTVVEYVTDIFKKNGLKYENIIQRFNGITIYPTEYFAPKSYITKELTITENTYSIHNYDASWIPENEKKYHAVRGKLCRILGYRFGIIISFPIFIGTNIKNHGIKNGLKIILDKFKIT
jgi:hypothetical protein